MNLGLKLHRTAIDRLPTRLKGALAAACAQRQAEVYRAYIRRTSEDTSAEFDDLLDTIWTDTHCLTASKRDHLIWHGQGVLLVPRKDAKRDIYKAGAEIAVLSLLNSNSVLLTGEAEDTCYAAHNAFMSIYNFLTSPFGTDPQFDVKRPDTLARIMAHPLTQAEHRRQERDLIDLEDSIRQQEVISTAVARLRKRSEIEAKDFLPVIDGARP
jgi:hypothetical protein